MTGAVSAPPSHLGRIPASCCPVCTGVASLVKRWLASTHQGAVDTEHLVGYLDEFCFRFNRRTSRSRGLVFLRVLQLAVGHDPVRYRELIKRPRPRPVPPRPPGATGHPPGIDRPRADRLGDPLTSTSPVKWRALSRVARPDPRRVSCQFQPASLVRGQRRSAERFLRQVGPRRALEQPGCRR